MKKVLVMVTMMFFVLPVFNVYAYEQGYFDAFPEKSLIKEITDNDLSTSIIVGPKSTRTIATGLGGVRIGKAYLHSEPYNTNIEIIFLNDKDQKVGSFRGDIGHGKWITTEVLNVHTIKYSNSSSMSTYNFYEFDFKTYEEIEHFPIGSLEEKHNHNSVDLKWINPQSDELAGIVIKKDGEVITTLPPNTSSYRVEGLNAERTYRFAVVAKYSDGGLSEDVWIDVITDAEPPAEPAGEVTGVSAKATHERVDLSWTLPQVDNLKHVIIYRDTLKKNLFDKLLGVATVKAAATPIFETNGTYFNDLTVSPETKYEYILTTMSTDKVESDGVSVLVTTPKKPNLEIEGGGYEKDPETGDYTYTWSKPTEGKVKIIVGGKLYKTVPAADGKIVIPAADMKYTIFGNPDVRLIPVSEDGTEGKPVNPPAGGGNSGGIGAIDNLPFGAFDLLKMTMVLVGLISGFVLLLMTIDYVPKLIRLIKKGAAAK